MNKIGLLIAVCVVLAAIAVTSGAPNNRNVQRRRPQGAVNKRPVQQVHVQGNNAKNNRAPPLRPQNRLQRPQPVARPQQRIQRPAQNGHVVAQASRSRGNVNAKAQVRPKNVRPNVRPSKPQVRLQRPANKGPIQKQRGNRPQSVHNRRFNGRQRFRG